MFRKLLKFLLITQEFEDKSSYTTLRRINPYNPLSYVTIIIVAIVGILMFGFVGIFKEIDHTNPFKWQ
jgi:hypothetical protein